MSIRQINIRTASDGSFTYERSWKAKINAIELQIGTLSTPDIDITDDTYSKTLLSVDGVSADAVYLPSDFLQAADASTSALVGTGMKGATAAVVMGVLKVEVTGAGDTKRGKLFLHYDS